MHRKDDCEIINNAVKEYNKEFIFTYSNKVIDDSLEFYLPL